MRYSIESRSWTCKVVRTKKFRSRHRHRMSGYRSEHRQSKCRQLRQWSKIQNNIINAIYVHWIDLSWKSWLWEPAGKTIPFQLSLPLQHILSDWICPHRRVHCRRPSSLPVECHSGLHSPHTWMWTTLKLKHKCFNLTSACTYQVPG